MAIRGQITNAGIVKFDNGATFQFDFLALENGRRVKFGADWRANELDSYYGLYVISDSDRTVLRSVDSGANWESVFGIEIGRLVRVHAGSAGLIARSQDPEATIHFETGMDATVWSDKEFTWHGTQGIGSNDLGTVIYGEYQAGLEAFAPKLHIWRRTQDSASWEPVLILTAGKKPPFGDIRHFHTCVANPFRSGMWLASSGDAGCHNRIWLSYDDGLTWFEPQCAISPFCGFPSIEWRRLLRFTSIVFLSDSEIIWGSDDGLAVRRSGLVRAIISERKINIELIGLVSDNYIRSAILFDKHILFITESKNALDHVSLICYDLEERDYFVKNIPNYCGASTSVTDSMSSNVAYLGVAFLPNNGALFTSSKKSIFRITQIRSSD